MSRTTHPASLLTLILLITVFLAVPAFSQGMIKTDITGYYTLNLRDSGDVFDTAVFEEVDFDEMGDTVSDFLPLLMPEDAWSEYDPPIQIFSNYRNADRSMGAPDISIFVRDDAIVAIDTTYGFTPAEDEGAETDESEEDSAMFDIDELKDMVIGIVVASYDESLKVDPPENVLDAIEIQNMFKDSDSDVLIIYDHLGTHVTYATGDFFEEFYTGEVSEPESDA